MSSIERPIVVEERAFSMYIMNRLVGRPLPASLPVSAAATAVAFGLMTASIPCAASAQTTVFSTGFETPTYTVGNLATGYGVNGQGNWIIDGNNPFVANRYRIVSGNGSGAGSQSLRIDSPTSTGNHFIAKTVFQDNAQPVGYRGYNNRGAGQGLMTLSFDVRINSGTTPSFQYGARLDSDVTPEPTFLSPAWFDWTAIELPSAYMGGVFIRPGATNRVFIENFDDFATDGVGQRDTGGTIPSNAWVNVKYELDYRVRRARVLVNDVQVGKYYTFNQTRPLVAGGSAQNRVQDFAFVASKNATLATQGDDAVQFDNLSITASTVSPDWVFTYNANASGSWTDSENWFKRIAPTVRPVSDLTTGRLDVLFPANLITGNRIVTVPGTFDSSFPARPVDSITFDSERPVGTDPLEIVTGYTIGGNGAPNAQNPGLLAFSGTGSVPSIRVIRGSHDFLAAAAFTNGATIRVENGGYLRMRGDISVGNDGPADALVKDGSGTFAVRQLRIGTLFVDEGTFTITGGGSFSGVTTLGDVFLGSGAKFDVRGPATLLLDTANNTEASVRDQLRNGIIVHSGETTSTVVLAYADVSAFASNVFGDVTADNSTIVLRRALAGDATTDGIVNFDDLLKLAANYNTNDKVWRQGDFNYDGVVNFDDLLKLAANYNQSLTGSFAGDWSLAQSALPEPTAAAMLVGAGLASLRRRR
jgi:hypothetical protein